jgi:hypothetical protein
MPYTAEISRTNPTSFIFLIDQSLSMREPFGKQPDKKKAHGVSDALNRLLQNVVLKCAKSDGVRDYFYIGLIGFGATVGSTFGGSLAGQTLVPISAIAHNPLRVEQRTRKVKDDSGKVRERKVKFPIWYEPKASGKTPMCAAFALARQYIEIFLVQYPDCYPPLVINITDGLSTDGNPTEPARAVQDLSSSDGNVLVFNLHISAKPNKPIEFPSTDAGLMDKYAQTLYGISSELPPRLLQAARGEGFPAAPGTRGFVFNADLVSVIRFLDVGTRVARGR